jgi:hypothetical protein
MENEAQREKASACNLTSNRDTESTKMEEAIAENSRVEEIGRRFDD